MTSKLKVIISICLSAGLGICWYPLGKLEGMQVESSQLLFFAFSAASLLTAPVMAFQVKLWRTKTLELLIFGLVGGIANALLHYSLLGDSPVVVLSLFSIAAVGSLFLDRIMKSEQIAIGDFLTLLCLILAALFILLALDGLKLYWGHLLAILAGVGFHRLMLLSDDAGPVIPIMSRVAAVFIASTWLVGMVLIFTPRSNNFPLENASLFSAFYGVIFLLPIIFSIVFIVIRKQFNEFLLWVAMLLGLNLVLGIAYFNILETNVMAWSALLLIMGCGLQLVIGRNGFLKALK